MVIKKREAVKDGVKGLWEMRKKKQEMETDP